MNIRAEAEANYHQRVGKATTKGSLRHLEIEKWNGQTPKFIGGGSTSVILPGSVD